MSRCGNVTFAARQLTRQDVLVEELNYQKMGDTIMNTEETKCLDGSIDADDLEPRRGKGMGSGKRTIRCGFDGRCV
jgi:hypothetical protein